MTTQAGARELPWTQRVYEAFPIAPAWVGVGAALLLAGAFVLHELALGRFEALGAFSTDAPRYRDVRLEVLLLLLLCYASTAYVYVIHGARQTLGTLRPLLDLEDARALDREIGRYPTRDSRLAGVAGVAFALLGPLIVDGLQTLSWPPSSPEVVWHRITAPFMGWWTGRFWFALVTESLRLSRVAQRLRSVDVFDLRPLAPFASRGLVNALLALIGASIFSLFLLEWGFAAVVAIVVLLDGAVAAVALLLPTMGLRTRLRAEKATELERCNEELRRIRRAAREAEAGRLADLLAYRQHVEALREWPFDPPTLLRLGLYLLIPLGSWAGGALAERLLDALL